MIKKFLNKVYKPVRASKFQSLEQRVNYLESLTTYLQAELNIKDQRISGLEQKLDSILLEGKELSTINYKPVRASNWI